MIMSRRPFALLGPWILSTLAIYLTLLSLLQIVWKLELICTVLFRPYSNATQTIAYRFIPTKSICGGPLFAEARGTCPVCPAVNPALSLQLVWFTLPGADLGGGPGGPGPPLRKT